MHSKCSNPNKNAENEHELLGFVTSVVVTNEAIVQSVSFSFP